MGSMGNSLDVLIIRRPSASTPKKFQTNTDTMAIKKIISGGQTGADQAGLDVAIEHGIPHGGAIPKGRLTEDVVLSDKYQLEEMTTKSYP
jgi:hypothetical protein